MRSFTCYKKDELLKFLKNFEILHIKYTPSYADFLNPKPEHTELDGYYFTCRSDIKSIEEHKIFWEEMYVKFQDDSVISLYSKNINSDDDSLLRINRNTIISPRFDCEVNLIEASKDLDEWLIYNGISQEILDNISVEIYLKGYYEYEGVEDIRLHDGKITTYPSENMKLSEDEVEKILYHIKDERLRLCVKQILEHPQLKYS